MKTTLSRSSYRFIRLFAVSIFGILATSISGIAHPVQSSDHPTQLHQEAPMPHEANHAHSTLEIPAGQLAPTVNLIVHPDAVRGWNLEISVSHFAFAPEHINTESSPTEGHAHLYVNGKKLTRLYSSWYYLESLPPGEHRLTVSLNTNRHEQLMYQGQPIEAVAVIQVPTHE